MIAIDGGTTMKRPEGPETNPYSFEVRARAHTGVVRARINLTPGEDMFLSSAAARKMAYLLNFAADRADALAFYIVSDEAA